MIKGIRRQDMKSRIKSRRATRFGWLMAQIWRTGKVLFVVMFGCVVIGAMWAGGAFERLGAWTHGKYVSATADMGLILENVQVRGRHYLPTNELIRAIDITPGVPLMGIDLDDVQTRVRALSWVRDVRVRRTLGGVIVIDIEERVPVALWVDAPGRPAIVDKDGVMLTRDNLNAYVPILAVSGEGGHLKAYDLMLLLQAEPDIAVRIKQANYISDRRWDLVLEGGMTVKLPQQDPGHALARLARAQAEDRMLDKDYSVIDLRHDGRIIVENKPEDIQGAAKKQGNAG